MDLLEEKPDIVAEAASVAAIKDYAEKILSFGANSGFGVLRTVALLQNLASPIVF